MPHIDVIYKRNVSRRVIRMIVSTLYTKACGRNLIHSESLDVYTRRLGKDDRQHKLIMVRIHADPQVYMRSRDDAARIEDAISSMLGEQVRHTQVGVEIVATPATS